MSHPELPPTLDSLASLEADGSRKKIQPADVRGRVTNVRRVVFAVLLGILVITPWIQVGGRPAILLDIPHRKFFLLGQIFNAQDAFLLFFLLTGLGFTLLVTTSLFGRMWCGFACPQSVIVDGMYRTIERLIEGPREARIKLDRAPMGPAKFARKAVKHALYLAIASLLAHALLGYFFPIRELGALLRSGPAQHPEAFAWTLGFTALFYFDGAHFREQFCVIMCPYGRLQSLLTDRNTILVAYDVKRGEPRGKLKVLGNGDCVDCKRCVAVCPTGIDIRQGLQLDCVGCGACIDACDEVMDKVKKPTGLIRFDSEQGLKGEPTKIIRPRTIGYAIAGLVGLVVFSWQLASRQPFEAALLRPRSAPYTLEGTQVRNVLRLHLVSKRAEPATFHVEAVPRAGLTVVIPQPELSLPALGNTEMTLLATTTPDAPPGPMPVEIRIVQGDTTRIVTAPLLGPGR